MNKWFSKHSPPTKNENCAYFTKVTQYFGNYRNIPVSLYAEYL